jgi:DnaJ-class molecular chaperone
VLLLLLWRLCIAPDRGAAAAAPAQVVTPGYVRIVKGEGMPKSKQPGQKGDLRIVFDVQVRPQHAAINLWHTAPRLPCCECVSRFI